ncbi:hypothetical protein AYI68_g2047 [Smittium mucronatum]|uniref:Uncharacterized protein n=1 Tax=Smittium mucronatum TaxID=133383 RepID=A0A1R0H3T2_9FUNG|nr:hypothetical protein AYI68_g2047 [Smittium mucronatum]
MQDSAPILGTFILPPPHSSIPNHQPSQNPIALDGLTNKILLPNGHSLLSPSPPTLHLSTNYNFSAATVSYLSIPPTD